MAIKEKLQILGFNPLTTRVQLLAPRTAPGWQGITLLSFFSFPSLFLYNLAKIILLLLGNLWNDFCASNDKPRELQHI
jgi:hypothetical protein